MSALFWEKQRYENVRTSTQITTSAQLYSKQSMPLVNSLRSSDDDNLAQVWPNS